ncbi:MAG: PorP/SprF family type IX secretion system membrane protein [Chitinophagales bacterium]|nr:PorP/SprF family type IX secretion system membrane protein [Bacteroidota bacterium]MCB9043557.1 PorP/SprF family type IX secretion system membrane protein [Chitinophagales bacterium]
MFEKPIFASLLFLLSILPAQSQQLAQWSQSWFTIWQDNPAAMAQQNDARFTAGARFQWLGIDKSPYTQYVGFELPLPKIRSGAAVYMKNDRVGALRITNAKLALNKKFSFGKQTLTAGVDAGIVQYALLSNQLITPDGLYEGVIDHQDALLASQTQQVMLAEIGVGLHWKNESGWQIGAALRPINASQVKLGENSQSLLRTQMHAIVQTRYQWETRLPFDVDLFAVVVSDGAIMQTQIGGVLVFDALQVGMALRGYSQQSLDAASAMLSWQVFDKLKLGYAYDLGISKLKNYNSGSHEVNLVYNLHILPNSQPKIMYNPRFL